MKNIKYSQGFGLIEMMIVISIIGITSAFAIPAFSEWVADSKTRSMTEVFQNNIRLAQTEALRRGRVVQFFLSSVSPVKDAPPDATGKNWGIQSMLLTNSTTASDNAKNSDEFIQGGTMAASNPYITVNASAPSILFNSIGRVSSPNQPVTIEVRNTKGKRKLNITVSLAGAIRICDADKLRASSVDGC